jgi:UDP-3-O-[3-hydroxymyristoyl] glucosamine N-acyltransferase
MTESEGFVPRLKHLLKKSDDQGNVVVGSNVALSEGTKMEQSTIVGSSVTTEGKEGIKLNKIKSFGSKIHIDSGK